jgi:hypothetical protein
VEKRRGKVYTDQNTVRFIIKYGEREIEKIQRPLDIRTIEIADNI